MQVTTSIDQVVRQAHFSNDFSPLVMSLVKRLCINRHCRQIVIVPSEEIKRYLIKEMASHLGGVAGPLFVGLEKGISLIQKGFQNEVISSSPSLMGLFIHALIEERKRETEYTPLLEYLSKGKRSESKSIDFALALGREFYHHSLYSDLKSINTFKKKKGWQSALYREVEKAFPLLELETSQESSFRVEVHLFAFSTLPIRYREFFLSLSSKVPLFAYFLSPTDQFWGDITSDREESFLLDLYQKKGVSKKERESLAHYIESSSSILRNFGILARPLFTFFEENFLISDMYKPPKDSSLLEALRKELFTMEKETAKEALSGGDFFRVAKAPSRLREIEWVFDRLVEDFQKRDIGPSDVMILSVDIKAYAPFIESVFSREDSPFSYEIKGMPRALYCPFFQTLSSLLELTKELWDIDTLFSLFSSPCFKVPFAFDRKVQEKIQALLKKGGLSWGFDEKEQEELTEKGGQTGGEGSFKKTLEKLITTIALPLSPQEEPYRLPISKGEEVLGSLFFLVHSLYFDQKELKKEKRELKEWLSLIKTWSDKYLTVEEEEAKRGQEKWHALLKHALSLKESFLGKRFSFEEIRAFLTKEIERTSGTITSLKRGGKILFAPLRSDAFVPLKKLYLIGMDEESFPRNEPSYTLSQMKGCEIPSLNEEDRLSLLKALLVTKEKLSISYLFVSPEDGKERSLSPLIKEVIDEAEKHLLEPIECEEVPISPLDHSLFTKQSKMAAASNWHYTMASSASNKATALPFFTEIEEKPRVSQVTVEAMKELSKNPYRFYARHALGLSLEEYKEKSLVESSEFLLSPLDRAILKKKLLYRPLEEVFKMGEGRSLFPKGFLGEVGKKEIKRINQELERDLMRSHLTKEDLFSVTLTIECDKPLYLRSQWFLPPLEVEAEGEKVTISGTIEGVSSQGLIVPCSASIEEKLEVWPLFLSLLSHPFLEDKVAPTLLFLEKGLSAMLEREEGKKALSLYISYYKKALLTPSPLFPLFGKALLFDGEESFRKKCSKISSSRLDPVQERNMKWFLRWPRDDTTAMYKQWSSSLLKWFGPFIRWEEEA